MATTYGREAEEGAASVRASIILTVSLPLREEVEVSRRVREAGVDEGGDVSDDALAEVDEDEHSAEDEGEDEAED